MTKPLSIDIGLPFDEAIAAARARGVVLPEVYYGSLKAVARSRAFTVSGLAALDQIQGVMDSLSRATESGETFAEWRRAVLKDVPAVAALTKARTETIFRTAIQTHYNIGRWHQIEVNRDRRPFLMYDAINDSRVRLEHAAMDGYIAHIDDPIWRRWYPPNGYNCRCSVIALTEKQALARGYGRKPQPNASPDKGWAYHPAFEQDEVLAKAAKKKREKAAPRIRQKAEALPVGSAFVEHTTAKAAAEWAMKANLVDVADYAGIAPEVANAWNRSLWEHIKRFPMLRPAQKFTGSVQRQYALYAEKARAEWVKQLVAQGAAQDTAEAIAKRHLKVPKATGNFWAHSWDQKDVSGIAINKKYGSAVGLEVFKSGLKQGTETAFHPVWCDTIKSVVDHELGHQLDTLLSLSTDNEVVALWNKTKLGAGIKAEVSQYANKNIKEFIAEAWAEYNNNPAPRRVAELIGRIVETRYQSRFGP